MIRQAPLLLSDSVYLGKLEEYSPFVALIHGHECRGRIQNEEGRRRLLQVLRRLARADRRQRSAIAAHVRKGEAVREFKPGRARITDDNRTTRVSSRRGQARVVILEHLGAAESRIRGIDVPLLASSATTIP